jgi:hypothetical protein
MQAGTKPRLEKIHHRILGLDRFELLELRRDDGLIQTFHAREVSTARPVQVHILMSAMAPENVQLLERLEHLPPPERRRLIDRGQTEGKPYVVTDRLAGFASLREWVDVKVGVKPKPAPARSNTPADHQLLDLQFHQLFDTEPTAAFVVRQEVRQVARPERVPNPVPAPETIKENPFLWMALGVVAALIFLILIVAVFAFRTR